MKRGALASAGTARADGRTVAKHADLGSVGGVGAGTIGAIGGGLIGHMIENRESGPTWLGAKGGGALGIAPAGVEREGDDGTLTGASLGALGAASIALVELVAKADKRVGLDRAGRAGREGRQEGHPPGPVPSSMLTGTIVGHAPTEQSPSAMPMMGGVS